MSEPYNNPYQHDAHESYRSYTDVSWYNQSDYQPLSTERRQLFKRRFMRIGGAVAGLVGIGLGAFAGTNALMDHNVKSAKKPAVAGPLFPGPSPEVTVETPNTQTRPEDPAAPKGSLAAEYEQALIGDGCDPITAEQAAKTYSDIFEYFPDKKLSYKEYRQQTTEVVAELEAARAKIEFPQLDLNEYLRLEKDAGLEKPSLSIKEYKAALQRFLQPLGMRPMFSWQTKDNAWRNYLSKRNKTTTEEEAEKLTQDYERAEADALYAKEATPLTPKQQRHSLAMRMAVVGTMEAFANTPKSLIDAANVDRLYLGDITEHNVAGQTFNADINTDKRIVIDTDNEQEPFIFNFRGTASHELSHRIQLATCEAILDTAWNNLNPTGFQYGSDNDKFTTIAALRSKGAQKKLARSQAVTTRAYGNTNSVEDFATIVGENVLDPSYAEGLFVSPQNSTVVYKKLALHIARLKPTMPNEAAYFTALLRAAQLEELVSKKLFHLYDIESTDSFAQSTDQQKIYKTEVAYYDLLTKLDEAQTPLVSLVE